MIQKIELNQSTSNKGGDSRQINTIAPEPTVSETLTYTVEMVLVTSIHPPKAVEHVRKLDS